MLDRIVIAGASGVIGDFLARTLPQRAERAQR